jgi:SAM-dependent methyltransferase
MLAVARARAPSVPLVRTDLQRGLPFTAASFDAVLSALVGEHLSELDAHFAGIARVLQPAGRLVFSVYAPELAEAGSEAHFEAEGVEYRLGAERHTAAAYERAMRRAGLQDIRLEAFSGDEALALEVPTARKYVGRPLLIILEARTSGGAVSRG